MDLRPVLRFNEPTHVDSLLGPACFTLVDQEEWQLLPALPPEWIGDL